MGNDYSKREGLEVDDSTEARLRAEIEDLKRQLAEQQQQPAHGADTLSPPPPSRRSLWLLALVLAVLILVAFFKGYIPHQRNEATLAAEAESAWKNPRPWAPWFCRERSRR